MESNWRFNVWNFGLRGVNAQLATRSPIPINPNRIIWSERPGPGLWILRASTDMGGYAEGGVFQNFYFDPGFPWGNPSEPD